MFTNHTLSNRWENFAVLATDWYIMLMLTLFPLFTGMDGYIALEQKKFSVFAICTALWLLCLAVPALLSLLRREKQPWCITAAMAAVFMAACTVSFLLSEQPVLITGAGGRYDGLVTYLLYGAILLGIFRYGQARVRYLYTAAAVYGVICCISALQLLGLNPLELYPGGLNYYDPYAREIGLFLGTLGNIDVASSLHCLMLPLLCAAVALGKSRVRFVLLLPAVLGFLCAAAAGVASGLLALGCTAAAAAAYFAGRLWAGCNAPPKRVFLHTAVILAVLALGALAAVYILPFSSGTLGEIRLMLHGEVSDTFGSGRLRIWRSAWRVFCENPIVGVGPDCLAPYLNVRFERWSEVLGYQLVNYADNAHNEYLNFLCCFGLAGFLPFAAAQLDTWYRALRFGNRTAAALLPAFFCYLVQAFFNIGLCFVTPLFLILWGLLLAALRDDR